MNPMTYAERKEILDQLLNFAEKKSAAEYRYVFAFGMLSAILDESQIRQIQRYIKEDENVA